MSDTRRQQILARIKTMLESIEENYIPVFNSVSVGKISPVDIETVKFPSVFVFQGAESRLEDNSAFEQWDWTISLEVWAKDEDLEHLLGLLHTEMEKNYSDGGLICSTLLGVIDVKRTGSDIMVVDPEQSIVAMIVTFSVLYRHLFGQP